MKAGIKIAFALSCAFLVTPSFAQLPFGLAIESDIYTELPTTDLGGGGGFSQSSTPIGPVAQLSGSVPFYGHSDTVVGRDPSNGALYDAHASSSVNVLSVSNGDFQLSIATAGGTLDADLNVQGVVQTNQSWQDTLTISGLATGTPVTLVVTDSYRGNIRTAGGSTVQVVHQIVLDDISSCQENCGLVPYEIYTGATSVDSKKKYLLHTRSGDTVTLFEFLEAELGGSLQWNISASFSNVEVFIDPLEPGAVVSSASQLNYSTPKP